MALLTSVQLGGLELVATANYALGTESLYALHSATPRNARMVEMADRAPFYVGTTPQARQLELKVFFLNKSAETRLSYYETLLAALETPSGLVTLDWTEGVTTKRFLCHVGSVEPDKWFTTATAALVAPNPVAEVI